MCYVYIINSTVKWYYVGSTNRLAVRMGEHSSGKVLSTKSYRPFSLIFKKEFELEDEARHYEKLLKDKRIEKEKIIKEFENRA